MKRWLAGTQGDGLPQLIVLGLACGLLVGCVTLGFRMAVELLQASFLPGGDPENYEALGATARFLLPAAGGLALGLVYQRLPAAAREVGAVHVIASLERLGARLLAALTAMVELTGNLNIVWPGMLSAIAAFTVSRGLFGQQPLFLTLLAARNARR